MESLIKPSVPVVSSSNSPSSLLLNGLRSTGGPSLLAAQRFPAPPPAFSAHNPFLLPYLRRWAACSTR